eukprot:6338313-Amphidinium_carterae.1
MSINTNPHIYPWREGAGAIHTPGDLNMFYWHGPISRQKWELECYRTVNAACYLENWRAPGSKLWCYACKKGHPDITDLAEVGEGVTATIRCRHSRFTPGISSWNPEGGYPLLEESALMSYQKLWEEEPEPDSPEWTAPVDV